MQTECGEAQARAGEGLNPPPHTHTHATATIKVPGEKAGALQARGEDSLRMEREVCEDPGKDGDMVGRRLGMTPGPHR